VRSTKGYEQNMGHLFKPAVGTRIGFSHSLSSFVIVGAPNVDWRAVAWSPTLNLFCAVGQDVVAGNAVMTSPDGIVWTQRNTAPVNGVHAWRDIVWADALGLFVAVGIAGDRLMTSPNGINWTAQIPADPNDWLAIAWSPELGLLCAVSNNGTAANSVMTSPNGINWTRRASFAGGVNLWNGIAWAPELTTFAAVGGAGGVGPGGGLERVMTSINGINWFIREIPIGTAGPTLSCVAWSPKLNLFAAFGNGAAGITDGIRTSLDGISWTIRNWPVGVIEGWNQIAWSPDQEMFAVVGGDGVLPIAKRVLTSVNGIDWFLNISNINTATDNEWSGIAWSPALALFAMVATSAGSTNFAGTLVAP